MRAGLFLLVAAAIALGAWLLAPGPFARGVVAGAVGLLVVGLTGLGLLARRFRSKALAGLRPPPLPTSRWDYALEATDLSGAPVDFARFEGRVLVVNLWATWCAPCVAEMSSLAGLSESTSGEGVEVACLSWEDPGKVRAFAASRGDLPPLYLVAEAPPAPLESRGLPATFVIDRDGRIVVQHRGAARWDAPEVIAYLRGLALPVV